MQDPLLLDLKRDKKPKLLKKQCHALVWWNCKLSQHLTVSGCVYITKLCSTEEVAQLGSVCECLWCRPGGVEHPKPRLYQLQGFTFTLVHSLRHSATKGVLRSTTELLPLVHFIWKKSSPSCLRWFRSAHHSTVSKDKHLIPQKGCSSYTVPI